MRGLALKACAARRRRGDFGVLFNIALPDSGLQANDFPLDNIGNYVSN